MTEQLNSKLLWDDYDKFCKYKNCHSKKIKGQFCKKHELQNGYWCKICKKYKKLPFRTHFYLSHEVESQ